MNQPMLGILPKEPLVVCVRVKVVKQMKPMVNWSGVRPVF